MKCKCKVLMYPEVKLGVEGWIEMKKKKHN
jgi:hypothetical protein